MPNAYFAKLKNTYDCRHLLYEMTLRQLKKKYAGSRLGLWWSVVTPLILTVSINFVFTFVFKTTTQNYTLFLLSGIMPWFFFVQAVQEATNSFLENSSILKQTMIPREFIPVSSVLANFLNFLIGIAFISPLFILMNYKAVLFAPAFIIILMLHLLFALGLGLLFSVVNVYFRDLGHFLSVTFMAWFWVTPVFYTLEMLDFPLRWVCLLNPVTFYIVSYQNILYEAKNPSFYQVILLCFISLAFFIIGFATYVKKESALLKNI